MANRWQMAKAFGRAMMEPLKAKDAGKVRDEVGTIAKKLDVGPREAYGEGVTEGFGDLGRTIQFEKKRKIPEIRKRMDELSDEATDKSLQSDFDEGFEEAVKRRNYTTDYDKADKLFTGKRANESAERFDEMFPDHWKATDEEREPMMRAFMIEELKRGVPIEDVLYLPSMLRRTGPID